MFITCMAFLFKPRTWPAWSRCCCCFHTNWCNHASVLSSWHTWLPSQTTQVASLVTMLLLLFGGFLLNKQRVPGYCRWIAKLSYFNYAYEVREVSSLILWHYASNGPKYQKFCRWIAKLSYFNYAYEVREVSSSNCGSTQVMVQNYRSLTLDHQAVLL